MVYLLNAKKRGKWKGAIEMKNELTKPIWRFFLHEFIIKAWWQNGCSYKELSHKSSKTKRTKKGGQVQITTCKFLWDPWSSHNNNVQFWASNLWQAQWYVCFFVSARERKGTQISHNNKSEVWRKSMREHHHHHHHTSFWIWGFLFCVFFSFFYKGKDFWQTCWVSSSFSSTHPQGSMISGWLGTNSSPGKDDEWIGPTRDQVSQEKATQVG